MRDHTKNILIALMFGGIFFGLGYALGVSMVLNWIVNTFVKLTSSESGGAIMFDLVKAFTFPGNLSQIAIHP